MSVNNDISRRNNHHSNESQNADDEVPAFIDTSSTTHLDTYFSDEKVIIPSTDNVRQTFKFINILIRNSNVLIPNQY